jgi:hypothetical protein
MTFNELPIGDHFKFYASGSLLTKTGPRTYSAPQWDHHDLQVVNVDETVVVVALA